MKERLQKIMSAAGVCSRRAAEGLILEGRVTVNGETASLGGSADPEADDIRVDGARVFAGGERTYIMLHKPRGYVTTLSDEKGRRTAAELIAGAGGGKRLYPVGRLDMNSEGLLLFTDDGELAKRLTHARYGVKKVYHTTVGGDLEGALPILRSALVIDGRRIRPAEVEVIARNAVSVTISEGRNRQVRRMCEAAGLRVRRLARVRLGPLELGDLPAGRWRYLSAEEIGLLRSEAGLQEQRKCE